MFLSGKGYKSIGQRNIARIRKSFEFIIDETAIKAGF